MLRPRRLVVLAAMLLVLAAGVYAVFPRHPDLRAFDPAELARVETTMWRDYYEKRYLRLLAGLYDLSRSQYGFSPWDSLRIAFNAAQAARTFQPTTSRTEADAALSCLHAYFRLLARGAPAQFDSADAARTELDWWQARRERVGADTYGLTIARVMALIYGVDNDLIRESGILRARAMAYRDVKGETITPADWSAINDQLVTAYERLKQGLAR